MRKRVILITGANGEVGQGLIRQLAQVPDRLPIIALDLRTLEPALLPMVEASIAGDILDANMLDRLTTEYEIDTIYHLAALLSTHSEFRPEAAHRVNVQGTVDMLHLAIEQARWRAQSVKFIFPSSIAVYGLPDLATKHQVGAVTEQTYLDPITMYGCNKLYAEHLGRYYMSHYRQLAAAPEEHGVDFRCVRFPGIISALTIPSGGTSDFAPEMIHAAAKGVPYACFVRPDAVIPFMTMPDAIKALLGLAKADKARLQRAVYNVSAFSLPAEQLAEQVVKYFPNAEIIYEPSAGRQRIIDSWPADMDDTAAHHDWDWEPDFDGEQAFRDYLVPTIRQQYA
ncbi:MAG: NAD-dependent epimerase/dehydratase family protein [Anaerolineae bacterium]|nr:NAD-dependent epimerase/dehydratase family protein [Anaerolineae bacterium]